jgi:SAM-dependent methyltransferase
MPASHSLSCRESRTRRWAPRRVFRWVMRMNRLGRWILNSPQRALVQRHYLIPTFRRLGGPLDGCRVLEVGCGRGAGMELIRNSGSGCVDGIDLDPVIAGLAKRRLGPGVTVGVADIAALPVTDASYDVVIDFGAIHLMPDWRAGLGEVARVMRPGGRFFFEQPAHPLYRRLMPLSTSSRRIPGGFGRDAFLAELRHLGLNLDGLARPPRILMLTGVLGDLVGVAHKCAR